MVKHNTLQNKLLTKFLPTNEGGTAKIYKKYKKNNSDLLDESFFPLLWKKK